MKKNRDFVYKKFLATALIGTMLFGVSGCNNSKENKKDITTEIPTTESTDVTTEAISEGEIFENELIEIAQKSYEENKRFYELYNYTEEDVIKAVKVARSKVEGYTLSELEAAQSLLRDISFPGNLDQALDNCNLDFNNKDVEEIIIPPHISDFYKDSDIEPIITEYELLRDKVVNELKENKSYSKKTAKKIEKTTAKMSTDDIDAYNSKIENEKFFSSPGELYVVAVTKYDMVGLCQMTNPEKIYITNSDGRKLKIGYTPEEININNQVIDYDQKEEVPPLELYEKYVKIKTENVITKYQENMCTFTAQLNILAGISKSSQIDILKQKKSLLEARKIYQDQLLTKAKSFSYKM